MMTPSRRGTDEIGFAVAPCGLGTVLVAATQRGVCAIMLGDQAEPLLEDLQRRFPRATLVAAETNSDLQRMLARIVELIAEPAQSFEWPLDVHGSDFQRRVWEALRTIPAGTTVTYGELAARVGRPSAVRAVASACGANPVAVAIPCHRVVGRDGKLTGYRWGIERKQALLAREAESRAAPSRASAQR